MFEVTATELFEEAPCGYLTTDLSGLIVRVNGTFERWTGHTRGELIGKVRFADLLSPGGRIYHETHYAPLLMMQGSVREIALDIRRADGTLLPSLVNSVLLRDEAGRPGAIRTTVFDATDRRRYERELVAARRREHDIALELQRSLLSGRRPEGPGFALEVFYGPAETALEVGGDWYDAFWVDDDTLGLVVGDVVGRGLSAAATMGQLRSAVRALAAMGLSPARLLHAMDAFCHRHELGQMTTLVYAQLRPADGWLRFAAAGHPPPALIEPGTPPRLLLDGRSLPLDAPFEPTPRAEAEHVLAAGATLLMYTDGLVERRDATRDGLEELVSTLTSAPDRPVARLLPDVARALADPSGSDDVCLLGLQLLSAAP